MSKHRRFEFLLDLRVFLGVGTSSERPKFDIQISERRGIVSVVDAGFHAGIDMIKGAVLNLLNGKKPVSRLALYRQRRLELQLVFHLRDGGRRH